MIFTGLIAYSLLFVRNEQFYLSGVNSCLRNNIYIIFWLSCNLSYCDKVQKIILQFDLYAAFTLSAIKLMIF